VLPLQGFHACVAVNCRKTLRPSSLAGKRQEGCIDTDVSLHCCCCPDYCEPQHDAEPEPFTITFDDIDTSGPYNGIRPIPEGYKKLTWGGPTYVIDPTIYPDFGENCTTNGYTKGAEWTSKPNALFNGNSQFIFIAAPLGKVMTVHKLQVTAAWRKGEGAVFFGYYPNGDESRVFTGQTLTDDGPMTVDLSSMRDIVALGWISNVEGSLANTDCDADGTQLVIDDMVVSMKASSKHTKHARGEGSTSHACTALSQSL